MDTTVLGLGVLQPDHVSVAPGGVLRADRQHRDGQQDASLSLRLELYNKELTRVDSFRRRSAGLTTAGPFPWFS